jgi:HPr kinase/phosphorylase
MPLHGSCVALDDDGVLILGASGTGKSDLVLRLIGRGWSLVADDQVELEATPDGLLARAPAALSGMLEVRGLGLFAKLAVTSPARLRLAVELVAAGGAVVRLPEPARFEALRHALPRVALRGLEPSLPDKVAFALAAACGRACMLAGAFAR